jgi:hypothetical protein
MKVNIIDGARIRDIIKIDIIYKWGIGYFQFNFLVAAKGRDFGKFIIYLDIGSKFECKCAYLRNLEYIYLLWVFLMHFFDAYIDTYIAQNIATPVLDRTT